jgi:hypothetical protein
MFPVFIAKRYTVAKILTPQQRVLCVWQFAKTNIITTLMGCHFLLMFAV